MMRWKRHDRQFASGMIALLGLFACTGAEAPPAPAASTATASLEGNAPQVTRVPATRAAARFTAQTGRADPPWSPTYPYHHEWARDITLPGCAWSPGGGGAP